MRTRDKSATVRQLSKVRLREELHEKLQRDAEGKGTTLNAALTERLERSFLIEETLGGGADALRIAVIFGLAGQQAAHFEGHPEWSGSGEWQRDPVCYETAALAVVRELWRFHPSRTGWAWREWFSRAWSFVAGVLAPSATRTELEELRPFVEIQDFEAGRRHARGEVTI